LKRISTENGIAGDRQFGGLAKCVTNKQ